jgi:putative endonuclease
VRGPPAVIPAKAGIQTFHRRALDQRWTPAFAGVTMCWIGGESGLSGEAQYAVYIMASRRNGTLYVGVTNNIARRAYEHRNRIGAAFTRKYGVTQLVWYEHYADVNEAIAREKQLKKWERRWKLELIEAMNPDWTDLYGTLNN